MKLCILILFHLMLPIQGYSQTSPYLEEIQEWQQEMNELFQDKEKSPLGKKDIKKFDGLTYFPIDSGFRIKAKFVRTPNALPFNMPTTTDRLPIYVKYGEAVFQLESKEHVLPLYQNQTLLNTDTMEGYLFLPFTDQTNGIETYGGGRYLDLKIPEGDSIILDFNKAYNPYCAYDERFSCPIPPRANDLALEIRAGVKDWKKN